MWLNFVALAATPSATIVPVPTPIPLAISSIPSQVTKGQTFSATLNIQAKNNQAYQFKIYGGVNGDNYSIEVQNGDSWINGYNGSWDSLPQATTDASGSASPNLNLRFKTDKTSGTCQLTAKIKEIGGNSYLLSSAYNLDVIDPPPPAPSPTPTTPPPTNTPNPTSTPLPTPTTKPSPSAIPTITIINDITATTVQSPTNANPGRVLGISKTDTVSPTVSSEYSFLPHILVGLGSLFLLVPLLIAKLG